MPTTLSACAELLRREGVRHHVDTEQGTIHVLLLTDRYANCRGEKVAIVGIETPDDGHRVRVAMTSAFAVGTDPAAACLAACGLAAGTPLVAAEYDERRSTLALVAEMPIEDGSLTALQLLSLLDRVVAAAETWNAALAGVLDGRRRDGRRGRIARSDSRRTA